jgi:voltage-gated potassium channel
VLDWVDGAAVVALAVVLTFEVLDAGDEAWLQWCNVALFAVFLYVFVERVRSGAFRQLSAVGRTVEVALLVVAIPLPGITGAGPIRLLRLIRLPLLGARRWQSVREKLIDRGPLLVVTAALAFAYMAALFILEFEKGRRGSDFDTLPDAIWWAATTMTTVGYGDLSPQTLGGRITAVVVMVVGISLFGLITALLATWLRGGHPGDQPATKADIEAVLARLDERG